jgi:hypothetical protein
MDQQHDGKVARWFRTAVAILAGNREPARPFSEPWP